MADEATLKYRGEYDNSAVITAMERQDQAFTDSAKTAEAAYAKISNADSQAAAIAKTSAAMRRELQESNAASSVRTAEKEAEQLARIKARAEQEYLRVDAQAAAAEAQATASKVNRAIEKENAYHQSRLQALIGNDEAQEAEARRHAAVMVQLQADVSAKSLQANQQLLARLGSMGNQLQAVQSAFLGVAIAAGDTDSKFGQMIGRVGLLASGALGMGQAFQVASTAFAGMGRTMLVAMPLVAAIGAGLAVILDHQRKIKELADKNDWLGDPSKFKAVTAAMEDYDKAQQRLRESAKENAAAVGVGAGGYGQFAAGIAMAEQAQDRLRAVTGHTRDELVKLYGDLGKAKQAWEDLAHERLIGMQFAFERAVIGAKKDGVDKAIELQEVSNRQAEQAIRNHYSAVLLDLKKTEDRKSVV